jgi:hypothetical protein
VHKALDLSVKKVVIMHLQFHFSIAMYGLFNRSVIRQLLARHYLLPTFLTLLGIYIYFVINTALRCIYMFNVIPVVLRVYKTYSSTLDKRQHYTEDNTR